MRLSQGGRAAIKQREGVRTTAYQDDAGIWTIGIGHVAPWVREGLTIDMATVERLFTNDVSRFERTITESVRVNVTQNQFDALVSFAFNIGAQAFRGSTLLKELNKGNYQAVPGQMMRWVKVTIDQQKVTNRGLINRRTSEVAQWNDMQAECIACTVKPIQPEGRKPLTLIANSQQMKAGAGVIGIGLLDKLSEINQQLAALLPNMGDTLPYLIMAIGAFIMIRRWQDSHNGRAY